MSETDFAPEIRHGDPDPHSVDDARQQISDTRHRISDTLDAIELRIADTRQEIRRKADVLRPVRERIRLDPWKALAIGAGAGLALGLLTGGSEERGDHRARDWGREQPREAGDWGREQLDEARDRLHEGEARARAWGREQLAEAGDAGRELLADARDRYEETGRRPGSGSRRSVRRTVLDNVVRALADAVADGLRQRLRRGATG